MNSKHLTAGDLCPPLVDGKLRIYSMRFCPYAQRALLVAAAKKIPYDVVNINLMSKPEFIFTKNPSGKVPAIEVPDGKGCLYESLIVCEYLDEAFDACGSPLENGGTGDVDKLSSKGRKLQSSDPLQRAKDKILVEQFKAYTDLDWEAFLLSPESKGEEVHSVMSKLLNALKPFEKELERRGTKFFGGTDIPGMVDYMIWPWIERLPNHKRLWGNQFDFDKAMEGALNRMKAWEQNMIQDEAVQESYLDGDVHTKYRLSKKRGTPNYDLLLQTAH